MKTFLNYKYIIVGKSGSGKDYLMDKMIEKGFKPCVKTTTRPMRNGEIQNKTYHFISKNEFEESLNKFLIYETFIVEPKNQPKETWYYGITKEEFENSDVAILTPNELSKIKNKDIVIIYLDINENIRRKRLNSRNDNNDSVDRRIMNDDIDFTDFYNFNINIIDPNFNSDNIIDLFKKIAISREVIKYYDLSYYGDDICFKHRITKEIFIKKSDSSISISDFEYNLLKPYIRDKKLNDLLNGEDD